MVGEFAAGLASLKTAVDIVRGLKDLSDKAAVASAISELQTALLSAQQESMSLVMQNAELTEQLRDAKDALRKANDFNTKKDRYTLYRTGMGAYVYVSKDSENPKNDPWYCQHCFEVSEKLSPMNFTKRNGARTVFYGCKSCGSEFQGFS